MNKNNTMTEAKVMFPLRLPPELYQAVVNAVREEKDRGRRNFSMNQFLTELIEKELKK